MSHELLESKMPGDYFSGHDDTYSSIKHEFSRIFHENNLQSFTNASDIGFLDVGKLNGHGISDNGEDNYHQSYQPYQNYQGYNYSSQQPAKGSASPFLAHPSSEAYQNNIYSQSPIKYPSNAGPSVTYSTAANKQIPVPGSPGYYSYQGYQGYQHYGQSDSPYLEYSTPTQSSYPAGQGYDEYSANELIDTHPNNSLGMMWSNDAAKTTEQSTEKTQFKVEQEFGSISNKKLGQQIDKAAKMNAEASAGLRRTTRVHTKTTAYNNIGKEDVEDLESGSDDDKEDGFGESKGRRSRGLRVLSLKVREIVSKKDKTSYKEVADALLEDLAQKMKGRPQAEIAKEEQNVKRRVYDALNVLIAADILQKEGKQVFISSTRSFGSAQNQNKKKTKQSRESILDMIEAAKQRKQEKQEALQELVFKNLAVKNLVRKNKAKEEDEVKASVKQGLGIKRGSSQGASATRIDVVEENPSLKTQTQENINFPFIVIVSGSAENSMNINMDASQKQLSIDSSKAFDIYGDIDVLLKMNLHYVTKSMFESEVPKELRKHISPQFVKELKK